MLEMAEDEKLVISEEQFRHFVQDDWDWRGDFLSNSAQYTDDAAAVGSSL